MTTRFDQNDAKIIADAVGGDNVVAPFVRAMISTGIYDANEIAVRTSALRAMAR